MIDHGNKWLVSVLDDFDVWSDPWASARRGNTGIYPPLEIGTKNQNFGQSMKSAV